MRSACAGRTTARRISTPTNPGQLETLLLVSAGGTHGGWLIGLAAIVWLMITKPF